ncbi:DnaD domain protein [Fructilactobacillus fructivorans]|uniref:Helicase loader DnaB n=1 Tax=Fructilactobacillus fructivorans TaxID=1614 RepID=A0A0C1Q2R4_9LACO|nr:DnaD domain protein [Fructilactobacillus fructivorans]KID42103.1 Helicase loader DnaB [Fructilactobacillus fructivorans]MCT0151995.1 hypothetical protein [Fructilactobacillus fructivorans]MCT2867887.1 hypothetical protein [Fructilactobacillus fructivorans]MCT2868531.1 hypothetical protein [Fructilactobacillus fructivorans]MCT2873531.1 hypothetical protein [Fructilactobacillus fructivorans]
MINGINPKSDFEVYRKRPISNVERHYIDLLYMPIIGKNAYALYNFLWLVDDSRHVNFELMSDLGIDAKELQDALMKLEGTGLLKTYLDHSDEMGLYKYDVVTPLEPDLFFNDSLLSLLLLEMVGEDRYLQLSDQMLPKQLDFSDLDDQTHNFLQVFSVNNNRVNNQPNVIKKVKDKTSQVEDQSNDKLQNDQFDFKLLLNILDNSFVETESIKKYETLLSNTNRLYGISEIEMAQYVEKASNLVNNRFDPQKFKILVSRRNQMNVKNSNDRSNQTAEAVKGKSDLSSQEQQLAQIAETSAPVDFLDSLKNEKGGFTTSAEERILSELVNRNTLSNGAINMLVYHILIDEEKPTINKNLIDTIANDWSQRKINGAAAAINDIKHHQENQVQSKGNRKRNYRKHGNVRETLPDWAKPGKAKQSDKQLSDEQRKRISEKLKSLNKKSGDE